MIDSLTNAIEKMMNRNSVKKHIIANDYTFMDAYELLVLQWYADGIINREAFDKWQNFADNIKNY